jgi:uncharacterized membrane protein
VRLVRLLRRLAGPFFILAGALHFVIPKTYRQIVPPYLPSPTAMVAASGAAEIAGGVGLIAQAPARRIAGWWLVATLVAVLPANVHMALHAEDYPKVPGGAPTLWARLPFQGVFIAWVLSASRR